MSQNHSAQWPFGLAAVENYTTLLDTRMQCWYVLKLPAFTSAATQCSGAPLKEGGK